MGKDPFPNALCPQRIVGQSVAFACANIRWNFATKFLVDATGTQVRRYDGVDPKDMEADIVGLLKGARSEL